MNAAAWRSSYPCFHFCKLAALSISSSPIATLFVLPDYFFHLCATSLRVGSHQSPRMDHSFMARFQSFSLRGSENLSIKTVETDFTAGMAEYNLCCVGCFICGKPMNAKNYRAVMCQVWGYLDLNIVKFWDRFFSFSFRYGNSWIWFWALPNSPSLHF